jgi:hypothetical protein
MICLSPIDAAVLADYWLALLPKDEEDAVEEHLFSCDGCAAALREIIALGEGVRNVAREGSLLMIVNDAFVECATKRGLRVRQYAPPRSGSVECTVTAEDDLLIGRLTADLSEETRIDLSLCDEHGVEQARLPDIPFQAGAPAVLFQQSITYAKAAPSGVLIARLLAAGDAGSERLLGEYRFNHTRTIPGPAGW